MQGLSPVAASRGHSSSRCAGLSLSRPLLLAEHRLQTRRLSSCGSRAYLLRGMWGPPRPGLEPVSPALAGRLSTTAPPGKPLFFCFVNRFICTIFLDSTYKQYHMIFDFLCLTSLSMTISRSIHVAANGIISFFFMAE